MSLEGLYERHGEKLFRYLVFRLGSTEDAEDVLQEAFCRFARYDLRWKLVRNPQAFVFSVARNEANRFLKRKSGRREIEKMIQQGSAPGFAAAFVPPDEPNLSLFLSRAEELPAEQKEIVFLKVVDGSIRRACRSSSRRFFPKSPSTRSRANRLSIGGTASGLHRL